MSKTISDAEIEALCARVEFYKEPVSATIRQLMTQRDEARADAEELGALADARCAEKEFIEEALTAAQSRIRELEAAVLAEREACAKVADEFQYCLGAPQCEWDAGYEVGMNAAGSHISAAIRSRPTPEKGEG